MQTSVSPSSLGLTIAIIGMGPRGLSVLERLIARLSQGLSPRPLHIYTIDPGEHGAGRIWHTGQPQWLLMNTVIEQITIFGENVDGLPPLGPRLYEWLQAQPSARYHQYGPGDYLPRAIYGEYLCDAYQRLTNCLPAGVYIHAISDSVVAVRLHKTGYYLTFEQSSDLLAVETVVLATGHPHDLLPVYEDVFQKHTERFPHLRYQPGDAVTGLSLHRISSRDTVALRGMGLTFYDIVAELTYGRGGTFSVAPDGSYHYHASGREPKIIAGSRSGLPFLARGKNQKSVTRSYEPVFLTPQVLENLRAQALRTRGTPMLDFDTDIRPLIDLEMELVFFACALRARDGVQVANEFSVRFVHEGCDPLARIALLQAFGIEDLVLTSLEALARPFQDLLFTSPESFRQQLLAYLRKDVEHARGGNVDNPLKAALDVLRDIRHLICSAVNFSGLLPYSQEKFESIYAPACALVSTGPPLFRVCELIALIEAGIVQIVGPQTQFFCDDEHQCFRVVSPRVTGSQYEATVLIEARLPDPNVTRNSSPLFQQLFADGLISEYVNFDAVSGEALYTGGVATTLAPYCVINCQQSVDPHMYAIGIPTEHTQWFTQVGSGRPGRLTQFTREADAIACDILHLSNRSHPQHGSINSFPDPKISARAPLVMVVTSERK